MKLDYTQAFKHDDSVSVGSGSGKDSNTSYEKGDHVLVSGTKRKLPALLGDKLDEEDYVEVQFYNKTKDKGWSMLNVVHVVKMSEIEKKISPPKINHVSRTRAFLEFKDLENLSLTESSDTSFDI